MDSREVTIPAGKHGLHGILASTAGTGGIVIFAHGSGSGRHSPRNTFVARMLQEAGIGTLLVDLLEEDEAYDRRMVFDIDLLAGRLLANSRWLRDQLETRHHQQAYFGASTGAAAALQAAAKEPEEIVSVVSRGGRPDLADPYLHLVRAPTLFIVGGEDLPVIPLNRDAASKLRCTKDFVIVPGASHLFEEPGTLERVAELARDWFLRYFLHQA